jgi:membrane fusion protein (multidrug efflux system)
MLNKLLFVISLFPFFLSAQIKNDKLEKEIKETSKSLQEQINATRSKIESELGESTTYREDLLHVILAPYRKTILSAQISTPVLSSQVSAPVKAIYKRMGESFKKGDILMIIDDTVYLANLEKARAVLDRGKTVLNARQSLFKDSIASFVDLKDAEAAVATAEAELALAENQVEASTIVAPYNGKVVTLNIEEYELPQPGQALMEIEEDDLLLAKVLVPSQYLKYLSIGKIIQVHLKETNTTVSAKIIRIGAVIDPSSSTIAIDAEINNEDGHLKSGMIGTTRITGE